MSKSSSFVLMVVGAILASTTFADIVTLKSGSTLIGKVGDIDGSAIAFTSEDLGDITIDIEKIAKIDESEKTHIVQYNDFSEKELPLTIEDGVLALAGEKFDQSDVKKIDPVTETWHGSINLGFNASRGNTYANSWSVEGDVNRRWDKDRFKANAGYYYTETSSSGKANKEKTTDRIEAFAQHDHFWTAKFYNFENAKFERDEIQLLDRRIRVGLGLGYQWADDTLIEKVGSWDFAQEAGLSWVEEKYDDLDADAADDFAAILYAHHLKFRPLIGNNVEFFHNLEYLPQLDDFERYLIDSDIGVTTKLIYNWSLLAKIDWDYNSRPARSRKSSDFRYIVGLGYKW